MNKKTKNIFLKKTMSTVMTVVLALIFTITYFASNINASYADNGVPNDGFHLGVDPDVDTVENPLKTRLNRQIVWANFDNAQNLGPGRRLQVGTTITMEPSPGYVVTVTVKSLQRYRATESYKNKVLSDPNHTAEDLAKIIDPNSPEAVPNADIRVRPQSPIWSNLAQAGFDVPGYVTLENGYAKDGKKYKETGVTFEVSATYGGVPIDPTIIIADGEEAGVGEVTIYETNGTPWQLMSSIAQTENPDKTIIHPAEVMTVADLQNKINNTSGASATGKAKYLLSTKLENGQLVDDPNGGLGTQDFSGVINKIGYDFANTTDWSNPAVGPENWSTPIVVSNNVTEFSMYYNIYGGLQSMMFGFVLNDLGDAPSSYKAATHLIKEENGETQPYLGDNKADADMQEYENNWWSDDKRDATPGQSDEGIVQLVGIGNTFLDTDGVTRHPKSIVATEEGYTFNVQAHKGAANDKSYIRGWIDFNHDGVFDNDTERSDLVTVNSDGEYTLTFSNPPQIKDTDIDRLGFRIRTALSEEKIRNATGFAFSGEVEDFEVGVVHPPRGIKKETKACQGKEQTETFTEGNGFTAYGKQNYNFGSYDPDAPADPRPDNTMKIDSNHKVKIVTPDGALVDTYTEPNVGTYTLSGDNNETITFTPLKSFTGKATGVALRAIDENDRSTGWTSNTSENQLENINGVNGEGYLINGKETMDAVYVPTVTPITPTASPATSIGNQGEEQTGTPIFTKGSCPLDPTYDVPMVPSTMVFEDGTKTKTVPGVGTYTINDDGTITFQPVSTFVGTAAPVTVKMADTNGTFASTTYTPTVRANPEITLTKSVTTSGDATDIAVGDTLTYTFVVENTGNVTMTDVSVEDPLAGLSPITPASVATLAPGDTVTFTATYTVTQDDVDSGKVENTATAKGTAPDGSEVESNESSASIPAVQSPSLKLEKSVTTSGDATDIAVGDTLTYTFVVENTGDVTMTDVSVEDPLAGLSPITPASVATLAPGDTVTFTATYTVTQDDVDSGKVENTAKAKGTAPDGSEVESNESSASIPAVQSPKLELTKSVTTSGDATDIAVGDTLTYTFVVENTGDVTMTDVSVEDPLAGLSPITPASVATLAPGDTATFTATYTVTQDDVDSGKVENTATAKGTAPDGSEVESNESSATIPAVQSPSLKLEKSVTSSGSMTDIEVGDELTYTFVVENTGDVTMTDVSVEDPLAGLSPITPASVATLAPGDTVTFTATYTVTQADVDNGKVENTAKAKGTAPDGSDVESNESSATIPAVQEPSLKLEKSVTSSGSMTDIAVGDTLTYTFVVENTGDVTMTDVSVEDPLAGLSPITPASVATLAPGDTVTFTATYTVTQDDVDSGKVENTAKAKGAAPDGSDVESNESSATIPAVQEPKLELTKSVTTSGDATDIAVGDTLTYTFVVENTGDVTMTDVSVEDPLAGLSPITPASVATLAPGDTVTFTATYEVTQADVDSGKVENTAKAKGTAPDGSDVESNESSATIPAVQEPKLELTKSVTTSGDATDIAVGDTLTYTFVVENTGDVTMTDVSVEDPLAGLSPITPASEATLAPGDTVTFTATYTVTQADVDSGKVENTAKAKGTAPDGSDVESNESSATIPAVQEPKLELTKSVTTSGDATDIAVGDTLTYTFVVENTGDVTMTDVSVEDPLADLSPITPASVATLAPGDTVTFTATYTVTQADVDSGKVENTAKAKGTAPDGSDVESNESSATIPAVQSPSLKLEKSVTSSGSMTDIEVGDTLTYTFVVENTGDVTMTDVSVEDPLAGLSPITPASVATLAPGDTVTFTATYTVTQADVDSGKVENTATAKGTAPDGSEVESNESSATIPAVQEPSLKLEKSVTTSGDATDIVVGDTLTYTFVVENTGDVTMTDVSVEDPLAGLSPITPASVATLAPGDTVIFTATYTVTQDDVDSGKVENTATAKGTAPDGSEVESNESSATIPAVQSPSLKLEKSVTSSGSMTDIEVGDELTYTFIVENTGDVTMTDVSVEDPLAGLSPMDPVSEATLAPGDTVTFTATYTVTQDDVDSGKVENTAKAKGTAPDGSEVESNESSATIPAVQSPSLKLEKSVTSSGSMSDIAVGDTLTYTFVVENTGDVTMTDVSVEDPLVGLSPITPASEATLAPGDTVTFTATYTVTQDDVDSGKVENTAKAKGTAPDGSEVESNESSATIPAVQEPSLKLEKSVTASGDATDIAVGDTLTYTFVVENTGDVTMTDVSVEDPLAGLSPMDPASVATLAPGDTVTFTATYTVTQDDVDSGKVENTAKAKGTPLGETDPVESNESTVAVMSNRISKIEVSKTIRSVVDKNGNKYDDGYYHEVDDKIFYNFTIKNTGNVTIVNVLFTDEKLGLIDQKIENINLKPGETYIHKEEKPYVVTKEDVSSGDKQIINSVKIKAQTLEGETKAMLTSVAIGYDKKLPRTGSSNLHSLYYEISIILVGIWLLFTGKKEKMI